MAKQSGIRIKVKTEVLVASALQTEKNISKLSQSFQIIEKAVKSSSSFWEGEGAAAFIEAYNKRTENINTAIRRFTEDVNDLQTIAGIYKQTEKEAKETAKSLSSDVII